MDLSLQNGEALRIRGSLRRGYSRSIGRTVLAWGLRLHRMGAAVGRRFVRARLEESQARALAELDARTLRDIGLEPYHGCSLADRIEAHRRKALIRQFSARLGPMM